MSSPFRRKRILALFVLLTLVPIAAFAQAPRAPDAVFRLDVTRQNDGGVECTWEIMPGHYLYRERISATTDGGKLLPVATAAGEKKEDPTFGMTEVYHEKAQAGIGVGNLPPTGAIHVSYQGCAEHGVCYPPVSKRIDLATLAVSPDKRERRDDISASIGRPVTEPVQPDLGFSATLAGGLPTMLLTFLGGGLLLALTPCVFPMIPILSGMLARSGAGLSAGRGFVLSGAYVLAMALAYAALGVAAAWSGKNLQVLVQTPAALGLMSLVFVGLALSMFGLYDLELPATWTARLSSTTAQKGGAIGGAALLGFGSALIVGPCVTPPLAAALLYVGQTGDIGRGAAALFALGLGMGIPLIVFGTFGGRFLPKSGQWLVNVKQAFGFIFLGLAIWMLERMLPVLATRMLWGALAIASGIWFEALDLLRRSGNRALRGAMRLVGSAVVFYGVLLLGSAGGIFPDSSPLAAFSGRVATPEKPAVGYSRTVTTSAAFDAAMAEARTKGQPILVAFTADWCTVCREIDSTVMADQTVRSRLQHVSAIRTDITIDSAESRMLMQRFGIVGPPTMLFVDARSGREIEHTRTIGAISAAQFSHKLDQAGV